MQHNRLFISSKQPAVLPETGYVRLPDVLDHFRLSKSTWYEGIKEGRYPKPVKIGKRAVGWDVDDIRRWKEANKAAS